MWPIEDDVYADEADTDDDYPADDEYHQCDNPSSCSTCREYWADEQYEDERHS